MKRTIILSIFVAVFFSLSHPIYAQWKNMAPNLLGNLYRNKSTHNWGGAMCYSDGIVWAGKNELWKSPDSGKTWEQLVLRHYGDVGVIVDIQFWDKNIGLVTCDTEEGCVYLTHDGGMSWTPLITPFKIFQATSAFFLGSSQIIVITTMQQILISRDGGSTWQSIFQNSGYNFRYGKWVQNGTAYISALDPIKSSSLLITMDYGISWNQTLGTTEYDTYSFDFDKCNPNIVYLINEEAVNSSDLLSDIYVSLDRGTTWTKRASGPTDPTSALSYFVGSVFSSEGVTYVPTRTDGILRSTDKGMSWRKIGGPNISYDTRFLAGIDGNAIFAVDSNGSVWATFNSGGDSISTSSSNTSTLFSSSRIINDSLNITIHLPIYFHHSGTMNDIDLIIHYPSTGSLKYLNGITYNGKSIDVGGSQWAGRAALHFAATDLNAAPDSLIGFANFLWTPYEYDCDEILFDSIDTHGAESPCSSALSSAEPFKGVIGSYKTCGISGVIENGINSAPLDFAMYPNPAKSKIEISPINGTGKIHYELFDVLGISRKHEITSDTSFQIDASDLAEGQYYLRMNGENGYPLTKKVIILK